MGWRALLLGTVSAVAVSAISGSAEISNLNAAVFFRKLPAAEVSNLNAVVFFRRNAGAYVSNMNAVIFFRL
jgi:hypothetical protein